MFLILIKKQFNNIEYFDQVVEKAGLDFDISTKHAVYEKAYYFDDNKEKLITESMVGNNFYAHGYKDNGSFVVLKNAQLEEQEICRGQLVTRQENEGVFSGYVLS